MKNNDALELAPEVEVDVVALLNAGQNLLAVKRIVESTGVSVAEAIGWVDRYFREDVPCPYCGAPLRTAKARQCFQCGRDWHEVDQL